MNEMKCKRCGANENRIHGFCSMECRTAWEYEDDIRDLTARIAELETKIRNNALWQASADAEERAHLEKLVPDLKKRIAELETLIARLIEISDWATIGMVISNSYSPSSNMRKLAEDRRNEWLVLVKDWEEREK